MVHGAKRLDAVEQRGRIFRIERRVADQRGIEVGIGHLDQTLEFSQFVIAGAAIGVVAEPFKDWQKAFWDNLATTVQLHNIKKVIAIDHRDCGAAKIAYGEAKVATREAENETHRAALAEFRTQVGARQPALGVETGLMATDGTIEMMG